MAIDFRTRSISVPTGTGRRSIESFVTFNSNVRNATVVLNGFACDFTNKDHHINIVEVDTDIVRISGSVVTFRVEVYYADKNFDDSYTGYVTATVIADTA